MGRIANSWALVKASGAVLRADKQLIVFPIVSTIGVIIALIVIGATVLFVPALVLAILMESTALILGTVVLFLSAIVAIGLVGSALGGIYTAAVYRYATSGDTGGSFDADLVRQAFRRK